MLKLTGVFVTDEEMANLRALAAQGWRPGDAIMVHSLAAGLMRIDAVKFCHALALKHGLPEVKGYYGINEAGEFVTTTDMGAEE